MKDARMRYDAKESTQDLIGYGVCLARLHARIEPLLERRVP
jgi:hypothetical protein